MPETIGTLNLKIVQLESRLKLLEQQQVLSNTYPNHQIDLVRESSKVRFQLHQLVNIARNFYSESMIAGLKGYSMEIVKENNRFSQLTRAVLAGWEIEEPVLLGTM